jgi:hypothetical protein
MDDEFISALELSAKLAEACPAEIYGRSDDRAVARLVAFVREMPIDKKSPDGESLVRIDAATILVYWAALRGREIPEDIWEIGEKDEESAYVALIRLEIDGRGPFVDAYEILH